MLCQDTEDADDGDSTTGEVDADDGDPTTGEVDVSQDSPVETLAPGETVNGPKMVHDRFIFFFSFPFLLSERHLPV